MDLMNTRPADIKAEIEARKSERQVKKIEAKPVYTPAEKAAVENAQTATFFAADSVGASEQDAMAAATQVRQAVQGPALGESVNSMMEAIPGDGEIENVAAALAKTQDANVKSADFAKGTTFADQIGAGFMEMTAGPALFRLLERPSETVDPNFDYLAVREKYEANRPEGDRQWLRESESQVDLDQKMTELVAKDARMKTLGAHGQNIAVAAGLTGGVVDPIGWVAGIGVGKVAQLGGIGARVAAANGQMGRAVAYGALEGAAGNVLYEAALDAAGNHVTYSDYITSAAFGAVFGQLALVGARSGNAPEAAIVPEALAGSPPTAPAPTPAAPSTVIDSASLRAGAPADGLDMNVVAAGVRTQVEDALAAGLPVTLHIEGKPRQIVGHDGLLIDSDGNRWGTMAILSPAKGDNARIEIGGTRPAPPPATTAPTTPLATPKEVGEDMMARAQEQNMDLYSQAQGRAGQDATPEQIQTEVDNLIREQAESVNRIAFADVPEQDRFFPAFDLAVREDGTVPQIDEVMMDPARRIEVSNRWGIDMHTVEDGTERKMLGELAARAEAWDAANPMDAGRLNSILGRVPWLASSGLQLARSENPVARMISGILLESTTGASGRRRTAAIDKTMRERQYMEHLVGYEEAYKQWRRQDGGSMYRDILGSDSRSRYDRLVASERESRRLGIATEAHPDVRRGSDALDGGYDHMRREQQQGDTIGAQRLGDSSVGYVHRALSPKWVMQASNEELHALSNKLAEQLQVGWDDVQFARKIATRYVERARTTAYGGVSVPANLASPEAASVLRDVLRGMSVGEADIERAMGRFSRGGASHTKGRLNLDLSENVDLPNGRSFPMMNAFETDQGALFQQYARRVSGDIALTRHGIHGDQGLKVLRKAMEYGPNGKRASAHEMEAFDQIAAEFYGRPLEGTGNKALGNLRMLTAASRLGGMAFTQFAETANMVSLLGVAGAIKHVATMPRLIADVAKGRPSELLSSIERIGGPLGQDHRVVFPFQEPNDVKIYGRDSLNAFDRIVRAGSNALPWLSGWHMMHAAQVRGVSEQIVHKAFRYVNAGEESAALRSMGLTDDLVSRLRADLPNIATFDKDGTLTKLDLLRTQDPHAAAEFVQAVHRGGKQIIQGTYIGETGKWAHNDLLRMMVQFRSFSLVSMEKQWTRQRVDVGTAKAFGLLMGQMAFALPIHLSRVAINSAGREDKETYLETQLHPAMLARAVLNYTSISGLSGDVLDAGASLAGFEASGVRSGNGSALGNIPALGYIESAAKVAKQKDAREAIRMLPGGNLPFLTPVVNSLTE